MQFHTLLKKRLRPGRGLAKISSMLTIAAMIAFGQAVFGQAAGQQAAPAPVPATKSAQQTPDKADAYYHYALGHMYSELAGASQNRGEYFTKAIDNYRLAMKEDPSATFISEELSEMYIQSGHLRDAVTEAEDALKKDPNDLNSRRVLARIYTRLIGDSRHNSIDETMVKKAIEQYQKITAQDPKDSESWLMLGRLDKVAQNSLEAEKAYKKVIELDPSNEDALTGLATVYADLGQTKEAADLMRKAAEKDPSAGNLTSLASTYEQMKEYSLAAETLKKAINTNPDNVGDLKRALAQDLLFSNQLDESLKIYQGLAADDPNDWQSQLRMSQIYRQQRNFAKARETADKAKAIDPTNLEVRYNEVSLLESERKLPAAIATLKDILSSTERKSYSPQELNNRVALLERLGFLYRTNEQYPEAVDTFRQIAQLDTAPETGARVEAEIIDTYRTSRDLAKASAESDAAAKKYPDDRVLRSERASLLADLGKTQEAVAEAKKLIDGTHDREAYMTLSEIYEKAKDWSGMAKALDQAESLSKTTDEKENVYFMRGTMLERQKQYDAAEAEFRKVLKIAPDNTSAMNYLGYMLADRNVRLPEAKDLIAKAVQLEPNNYAYLDSLGWVYFRLNDFPEAEQNLRRALDLQGNDPTVHDHLGDVYFHQGKLHEAIAQWQLSLKYSSSGAQSDVDQDELAKVHKKLDNARVRLARENGAPETRHDSKEPQ